MTDEPEEKSMAIELYEQLAQDDRSCGATLPSLPRLDIRCHTSKSVPMVSPRLSPTLWRTCRALANRRRLRLLQYVISNPGVNVSSAARALSLPMGITSSYLRALNARGLLRTTRRGKEVFYTAADDPTMPETRILLEALKAALRSRRSLDQVFAALTAFTHPRRIQLVRALSAKAMTLGALRSATGISRHAAVRHLKKLIRRGHVHRSKAGYSRARPPTRLARALQMLALGTHDRGHTSRSVPPVIGQKDGLKPHQRHWPNRFPR